MKRVFAYLRVSGRGQVDGDGFDRQKDTINAFCEAKGWVVLRFFREEAVSGTVEHADRPAFSEMLSLMGGEATTDTFVVERADRLARDLMVSELLVEEARKSGVKIFEAASDTDLTNSDDPTRVMIRQMLGVLAQWEKNNLVRKLRAARERIRHEKGRCEGIMRWEDLNPENQKLANRLVQFRNEGHSFATIAKWMNGQKVPAVRGNKWSRSSVHAIYARVTSKPYQPSAIQLSKV